MVFAGFKKKGKRKKTTLKIGNNRIDNYNKINQKFNNGISNISRNYNTNTAIITLSK